jgi:hypothetical protein
MTLAPLTTASQGEDLQLVPDLLVGDDVIASCLGLEHERQDVAALQGSWTAHALGLRGARESIKRCN